MALPFPEDDDMEDSEEGKQQIMEEVKSFLSQAAYGGDCAFMGHVYCVTNSEGAVVRAEGGARKSGSAPLRSCGILGNPPWTSGRGVALAYVRRADAMKAARKANRKWHPFPNPTDKGDYKAEPMPLPDVAALARNDPGGVALIPSDKDVAAYRRIRKKQSKDSDSAKKGDFEPESPPVFSPDGVLLSMPGKERGSVTLWRPCFMAKSQLDALNRYTLKARAEAEMRKRSLARVADALATLKSAKGNRPSPFDGQPGELNGGLEDDLDDDELAADLLADGEIDDEEDDVEWPSSSFSASSGGAPDSPKPAVLAGAAAKFIGGILATSMEQLATFTPIGRSILATGRPFPDLDANVVTTDFNNASLASEPNALERENLLEVVVEGTSEGKTGCQEEGSDKSEQGSLEAEEKSGNSSAGKENFWILPETPSGSQKEQQEKANFSLRTLFIADIGLTDSFF